MSDSIENFRSPRHGGTRRAIQVAAALSVLLHIALLWGLPRMSLPSPDPAARNDARRSLSVNLVPLARPPVPPPAVRAIRPPAPLAARPSAPERPAPAPSVDAPRPPASDTAVRPRSADSGDLSAYIEEKRRARALPPPAPAAAPSVAIAPAVENDEARRERIAAANLALPGAPVFGYDPTRKGGAFQIRRLGHDDAEFIFYGWDKEVRRNMARLIEVRKGNDSDIRVAVVRRMIAIIRDYEQGDFLWESSRLRRNVTLSAHARDNERLEAFMMEEFFNDPRGVR